MGDYRFDQGRNASAWRLGDRTAGAHRAASNLIGVGSPLALGLRYASGRKALGCVGRRDFLRLSLALLSRSPSICQTKRVENLGGGLGTDIASCQMDLYGGLLLRQPVRGEVVN